MYWKEFILLLLAVFTPIVFYFIWRDASLFQASGSIMVFLAVLTEFLLLNKLNVKHINNALRVKAGQMPLRFSTAADVITWFALGIAAIGTIIWGFGDRFI